ncbi:Ig-like domain-containing protein [Shewanella waksmanii]|uniref:Ig-like domain-containing protein n=1 Tax=Shewanella waksmanii TaxID=213783 RepID=UPI003735801B
MQSAFKVFVSYFLLFFIVACSGGGDISDSGGGGTDPAPDPGVNALSVSISSQFIDASQAATVSATVTNSQTGAVAGELVTFTLNDQSLGSFSPGIGTALTDANGIATILLATSNVAGAGTVEASIDDGASGKVGFNMAGDGGEVTDGAVVVVTLTDGNGQPIDAITSLSPGKISATVTGVNKPVIVTFSSTIGDLPIKTAVTNSEGVASVDIYAGSTLGAGEITAALGTGEEDKTVVVIGATNVVMGSGDPFVVGQASVSVSQLPAGGTASISVIIQDDQNNLFTQPVDVNFTSTCSSKSTPEAEISSPVPSVNGVATTTYLAKGCVGDDAINVTANAGGLNLSATATLRVLPADVGSIVYVSAEPENISILGTGGDESSVVKFRVLDTNSNPVSNQSVSFALNTVVGGISLDPMSATTNSEGIAQTVIRTGTVATSVRVTATVDGSDPVISSQSKQLVISTGIPDQDSFSLSAEVLNAEGWDIDGTEVKVTARLADAFNNPVPDGTSVAFTTEGGSIGDACQTVNGACSVVWTSQNTRPDGETILNGDGTMASNPSAELAYDATLGIYGNVYGQKYGGRATITATAIGEESFPDHNGNGRFDVDEVNAFLTELNVSGKPFDLDDAYNDYNEDGLFNPQQEGGQIGGELEELVDFNSNQVFDTKDGLYNGVLCSEPAHSACADGVSDSKSLYVRGSLVLVMSGSTAFATERYDITIVDSYSGPAGNQDGSIDILGKGAGQLSFAISDLHNQQMPAGTKVTFVATAGSVVSTSEYIWPSSNRNSGRQFSVTVKGEDEPNSGVLLVNVETPGGTITQVLAIPININ